MDAFVLYSNVEIVSLAHPTVIRHYRVFAFHLQGVHPAGRSQNYTTCSILTDYPRLKQLTRSGSPLFSGFFKLLCVR